MAVHIGFVTSLKLRDKWKSLSPPLAVKWDDLEINQIYHIPPIDGHNRRTIKVLSKGTYWIKYTEKLINYKEYETDYLYSSDIAACFIFKVNKN